MIRLVLLLVVLTPLSVAGQEQRGSAAQEPPGAEQQPSLGLESLLTPRSVATQDTGLRGGKDRATWRLEFERARNEVAELEQQVASHQQAIRDRSTGDWGYTPTGGGAPSDPEVLRLRAEIKRDRQSLEAAQNRLRELEVEASLAEVPDAWLEPDPGEAAPE
jgi:hypothetical protein